MKKLRKLGVMMIFTGVLIMGMVGMASAYSFNIGPNGPGGNQWALGAGWGDGPGQLEAYFTVDPGLPSVAFDLGGRGSYNVIKYGAITLAETTIPSEPGDLSITAYLYFTEPTFALPEMSATAVTFAGTVNDPGDDLRISFDSASVRYGGGAEFQIDLYPEAIFDWQESNNVYARVTLVEVPEPATMLLLGLGLVGIAGIRRRMRN